ncbi:hypothetical protein BX600DRAFT_436586 [Xylariales sp. PMI_506]|nr:hypothetical protein BX600DRAFT_436586 [Xylariales sp. PMI_506]
MAAQDPTVSTESNGIALVVTAITFLILSWISVALRTYVRAIMLKGFKADDWLMLVSQVNFTLSCAFILRGCYYGLGRHDKSLDQYDEIAALEYQALATATYVSNMMFIKVSIGIFLLRIATQKPYRYTIWASIAIVGIWSIVLFFWNIFQCSPVKAQWDYTILATDPNSYCVSADQIVSAAYALSVMNILSDWLYALLPIPMVWNVSMTKQAKATVVVILGMGIFASIATLIRLKFLADLTDTADILFSGTDAMVWTLIEPGVAIVASSLVTIRPLLRAWKVRGFQSTENSKLTGPFSAGHLSSRKPRSGNMPGFGSRDVTLVDVETGVHTTKSSTTSSTTDLTTTGPTPLRPPKFARMSRISERTVETPVTFDPASVHSDGQPWRKEMRQEFYASRPAPSPNLPGHTIPDDEWPLPYSPTQSEVELDTLEPKQSQSDGRVGLGSRG